MSIKLVIGLQNPGTSYQQTRHNVGAWFVQDIAENNQGKFKTEKKLRGDLAVIDSNLSSCKLLLAHTFMNESGISLRSACDFYKIKPQEILVCHDELDLDPGRIKLKTGGGHGGHNGLRSIINHLGSNDFHRLRIGIGHPQQKHLVTNYVLSKPSKEDRELIFNAISRASAIFPEILSGNMEQAMCVLNG